MKQSQSLMRQHYSTSESCSAPVSRHGPIFGVEEDPAGGDQGPATSNRKCVEYRSDHAEPELVVQRNQEQLLQNIQLQVLMEPTVLPKCSLTLKILSLEFQNLNAANCRDSSSSILRRFFLSRVVVTVTPESNTAFIG